MTNLQFAQPMAFWLLLLLPVLIVLITRFRATRTPKLRFSSTSLIAQKSAKSMKIRMRPLPTILYLLAFTLMVGALARPQNPWAEHKRKIEGLSIMLVIDVSESMRALDFDPNRLEKSKEVVKDFISGRDNDMIGLTIFAAETFTLCPLTQDYAALQTFVDRIDFDLVNTRYTAIGMGLANAVNKLKDTTTKSKVVILLTDGENNWGEISPITAAEVAQKLDMRVYTIGVGSQGVVDIMQVGPRGRLHPSQMFSNIDKDMLQKVADMTGGQFFEATDGESLEEIYDQIDEMERTELEVNETNYFDELAHFLIVPAMLLFGLGILLEQSWLWSFP